MPRDPDEPGWLSAIIGGGLSAAAGTTSPMQAYQMGIPQAQGLTMEQLQQLVTMHQSRQQLPLQQAQLADFQSQANLRNSQADWYARRPAQSGAGQYGNLDNSVEGLHQWIESGGKEGLPPDGLPGFGANSLRAQAMAKWQEKYPQDTKLYSQALFGEKGGAAGAVSGARAPNSPSMFAIRAKGNALLPQLDMLEKASDAVSRGDMRTINSLKGRLKMEFSNKDWTMLKKRAILIADEFQSQIGAGSDKKFDAARELLDTAANPETLRSLIQMMSQAVKARSIASTGAIPTEGQISGDTAQPGGSDGWSYVGPMK